MQEKLRFLFALQQVDTQLHEVEELKGDLPSIVAELQTKADAMAAKIKELNSFIKQSKVDRDKADMQILDLGQKVEKYKGQQLQVKSNKQYDALTREIESAEQLAIKLEKDMGVMEGKMQVAHQDGENLAKELEDVSAELKERQKELREVSKEHEKEELKLRHDREKLQARISKEDYERYERIRGAKGGTAIVLIKRGACGGCYSRIPPQKILELRQSERFFMCENCGRVLISDHIAEMGSVL